MSRQEGPQLNQTRYSYNVEYEACLNFMQGILAVDYFREYIFNNDSTVHEGTKHLLHPWPVPFGEICDTWWAETGFETFSTSGGIIARSATIHAVPVLWHIGVEYLYALEYRTSSESCAPSAQDEWLLHCHLAVTSIAMDQAGRSIVRLALLGPRIEGSSPGRAGLANELAAPFYLMFARTGRIERIWLAETILRELAVNDATPAAARAAAIRGLARGTPPSETALDVLWQLADAAPSVARRIAILTLGTAAHHMLTTAAYGAAEGVRATRLVDNLVQRYNTATTRSERLLFLAALGNTGSAQVVPVIGAVMGDDDRRVRGMGISALRLVAGAQVDELIAASLSGDVDAEVRRSALMAASYRKPVAQLEQVARTLREDTDTTVRCAALKLLQHWQQASTPVSELIRWTADHDPDIELRTQAQNILIALTLT